MATLGAIGRSIAIDIPVDIELEVLDGPPTRSSTAWRRQLMRRWWSWAHATRARSRALAGAPAQHLMRNSARPVLVCPRPQRLTRTRRRTAGQISSVAS